VTGPPAGLMKHPPASRSSDDRTFQAPPPGKPARDLVVGRALRTSSTSATAASACATGTSRWRSAPSCATVPGATWSSASNSRGRGGRSGTLGSCSSRGSRSRCSARRLPTLSIWLLRCTVVRGAPRSCGCGVFPGARAGLSFFPSLPTPARSPVSISGPRLPDVSPLAARRKILGGGPVLGGAAPAACTLGGFLLGSVQARRLTGRYSGHPPGSRGPGSSLPK
jgi:hypothetical protein